MKQIRSFYILSILCVAFAACHKDLGNYNYRSINQLSFSNIDTAHGYSVYFGQTLSISPQIKGTQDADGTKRSYSYEWSFYFAAGDSVISTQKDLNVIVNRPPGTYTLQLRVKDNESGVRYAIKTTLLVTTKIFEGYLVLNDVNGKSRLDMITYYRATDLFEQHTDILAEMGSQLPTQGKPLQVYCMETESYAKTAQTYRIYLVTETGTNKIDPETFGWDPIDDFKYEVTGNIPADLKPSSIQGRLYAGSIPITFFTEGTNIYRRGSGAPTFPYVPVNIYAGGAKPFRAFPQIVSGFLVGTIFDMDNRVFTSYSVTGAVNVTSVAASSGMPSGKDMLYMGSMANGAGYAVLKDPGAENYYLLRFAAFFGVTSSYFSAITGTDIGLAEHYALSPDLGYLFYSVGGKLYEYDPFLKTSYLMLDKGASTISYIGFQSFSNASNAKYAAWGKQLLVGTYDPSGSEGSNGTLEQFTVPPVNAALQLEREWTGFGKIASISFRERN